MSAFYNEIDPYAAQWLRNLIAAGHIAPGVVDERSIEELDPDELRRFTQCHFFAGIGVWSYALRLAGWPDDRPVWTGSCPCQPFSAAGKGEGYADERHLWPHWLRIIRECRPSIVFGEQVAAAIGTGWIDDVSLSLEKLDYAIGSVSFPACSVGAPHRRQRILFFAVGHAELLRCDSRFAGNIEGQEEQGRQPGDVFDRSGGPVSGFWSDAIWLPCTDGKARPTKPGIFPLAHGIANRVGRLRAYGNAICAPQATEFVRAFACSNRSGDL